MLYCMTVYKNNLASSDPLPQTSIKMGRGNGGCGLLSVSQENSQAGTQALSVVQSTEVGRFSEVVNTLVLW